MKGGGLTCIDVREARRGDATALASLVTELGYPASPREMSLRFARISADPSYATLVAEREGEVVGMTAVHLELTYEADAGCARMMAFVVASEHRGRGVGRALISAAEDWARRRGAEDIMLTTHESRAGAHAFYRRMGYEFTGYRFHKPL